MQSDTIYRSLISSFITPNKRYCAWEKNVYMYSSESDLFLVDTNDMVTEIEVKASKSDFLADFNKSEKHNRFKALHDLTDIPNHFYFSAPEGLIDVEQLPEYAGLIEICQRRNNASKYCKVTKRAEVLHNWPFDNWKDLYFKSKRK